MKLVERRIDKLGRIVLPMDFRKALGLEGEAELTLSISGNAVILKGIESSCKLCGSSKDVLQKFKICREIAWKKSKMQKHISNFL